MILTEVYLYQPEAVRYEQSLSMYFDIVDEELNEDFDVLKHQREIEINITINLN